VMLMSTYVTVKGDCACGQQNLDITVDATTEIQRNMPSMILRAAANKILDWLLGKQAMYAVATCNKCGKEFEIGVSGTKKR